MELFRNEFLSLDEEKGLVFISVYKQGYNLNNFDEIISRFPRISITKFMVFKEALELAESKKLQIGEMRPLIMLQLPKDLMSAKIRINCTASELEEKKDQFISQILQMLHENEVKEGILVSVLHDELVVQKDVVIAKGVEPQNGKDAELKYYQPSERKPTITEDGKANFYDMNFIDEVQEGEWLGDKIPPTEGIPGKTVTGESLPPKKGKDKKFVYDRKTVGEFEEDGKMVLRALVDGVVSFEGGKISVGDHLIINGDIGVETGNIDFDGSVTIKGIVQDHYSVSATKDISILGEMGISGVKEITSLYGDIYIKGGVFGKGFTIIKANKNIFVKHANDCTLEAGEDIHIGYYSIGSVLKGKNIIADERNGKLIGGHIEAKGKVTAAIIGNKMERKTIIEVQGFDRKKVESELEELLIEYKTAVIQLEKLKRQLDVYESFLNQLSDKQKSQYIEVRNDFEKELVHITTIDDKRKSLISLLETKGEGQVSIAEMAYPDTMLQIKNQNRKLNSSVKGTFYVERNNLHFE